MKSDFVSQCGICHLSILYTDDYVCLIEYLKGQQSNKWHYHRKCFREKLNGTTEMKNLQTLAKDILNKANARLS